MVQIKVEELRLDGETRPLDKKFMLREQETLERLDMRLMVLEQKLVPVLVIKGKLK